jgi:hypothetical protein
MNSRNRVPRRSGRLAIAVVCAGLALSAFGVASAQSAVAHFQTAGSVNAAVEGHQTTRLVFGVEGSKMECQNASFSTGAEIAFPAASLSVNPTYGECVQFGFIGATVTTTGCQYVINPGTLSMGGSEGTLGIACEAGHKITMKAGTCEVQIGTQSGLKTLHLSNSESGSVGASLEISNMVIDKTKDGFLCPLAGTGEAKATLTGAIEFKAFAGNVQTPLSVS